MRYDWSEAFLRKRKTGAFTSLIQAVRANAVAQKTKMARPSESGKVRSPAPPGHMTRNSESGKVSKVCGTAWSHDKGSSSRATPWTCCCCCWTAQHAQLLMPPSSSDCCLVGATQPLSQGLAGLPPLPVPERV